MKILLDLGGGSQPHTEEGYKTISTDRHDFSKDVVLQNVEFVQHDLLTVLPFDNEFIDKVWSHHVFEHLPHQLSNGDDALIFVMREVARVLKPGGEAHIIVPWMKHPNATRHPCHYRFYDHELFNWFTHDYPSPDLEAYNFPRVLQITRNEVVEQTHVYAIFKKL